MKYLLICGYEVELISRGEQLDNFDALKEEHEKKYGGLETTTLIQYAQVHGINPTCSEDFKRCPNGVYYDGSHKCYESKEIQHGMDMCIHKHIMNNNKTTAQEVHEDDINHGLWKCKFECSNNEIVDESKLKYVPCENYKPLGGLLK